MNKILLISSYQTDLELFEQVLQETINNGGELLFCTTQKEALEVIGRERPSLIFSDAEHFSEAFQNGKHPTSVVTLRRPDQKQISQEELIRPLKFELILEKCLPHLTLAPGERVWPM